LIELSLFPVILEIHLKTNNKFNVNHQLDIDKVLNNSQIRQWLLYVVMASIVVICAYESILGVFQLIGCRPSNHYLYAITGSFDNPGPYGGFLAICVSVIGAYVINNKPQADTSLFYKAVFWIMSVVALFGLMILPSTQSRTAILALVISISLLAFGTKSIRMKIKPIIRKYGIRIILVSIALGTSAYLFKKPSADGRLFMDRISIMTIWNNGLKGVGRGHFGGAYGETQARYFQNQIRENGNNDLDWTAINEHERMTAECPDNAFNEYLFIGVEYGLIVMLLFIAVIILAILISFKRRTVWCYGMTAFAVFALFSYPLHVTQFQILFPILLLACISDTRRECNKNRKLLDIIGLSVLSILLVTLSAIQIVKLPEIRQHKWAEAAWKKAERWYQMEYYDYVVEDCDSLLPYMKTNQQFLFAYGQSLNKIGNYEKSDSILNLGTEISSDPMFWNVMGNNSLALGRYREAEERYKHAFYMVPNRLYPLTLLAKLYHTEGDTVRFLDMAEKVETFVPKIENANTERLRAEIREIREGYNIEAIKKDEEQ
jgi:tetratricopeptide (TPR) repeat protein